MKTRTAFLAFLAALMISAFSACDSNDVAALAQFGLS